MEFNQTMFEIEKIWLLNKNPNASKVCLHIYENIVATLYCCLFPFRKKSAGPHSP
jgi:hypothetical protein